MLEERLYTWAVIIETFRVHRIDTAALGVVGKPVFDGTSYDTVYDEAFNVDTKIGRGAKYSLETARLVLKYLW